MGEVVAVEGLVQRGSMVVYLSCWVHFARVHRENCPPCSLSAGHGRRPRQYFLRLQYGFRGFDS